jgi:hypothetical protein
MADFFDDIWRGAKGVLQVAAPTLGTMLGGPLGGLAGRALAGALGLADGTPDDQIAAAVAGATPEQLLAIKNAESEMKLKLKQLDIDLAKIDASDRDSARKREIEVKDRIPGLLAFVLTVGYFGTLGIMIFHGIPKDQAGSEALITILGGLSGGFGTMLAYYYGASNSPKPPAAPSVKA